MAHIGEPIRRITVVPVEHPVVAPEGPQPPLPEKPDTAPVEAPEKEPAGA